ncbi:MAG: hypothetical protein ACPGID_05135 [Rubricella sp.]
MRTLVLISVEDATGQRCVDILRGEQGFGWCECRRDPEDPRGWSRLAPIMWGFASRRDAVAAARDSTGWMETGA